MTPNRRIFLRAALNIVIVALAAALVGHVTGAQAVGIGVLAAAANLLLDRVLG